MSSKWGGIIEVWFKFLSTSPFVMKLQSREFIGSTTKGTHFLTCRVTSEKLVIEVIGTMKIFDIY